MCLGDVAKSEPSTMPGQSDRSERVGAAYSLGIPAQAAPGNAPGSASMGWAQSCPRGL